MQLRERTELQGGKYRIVTALGQQGGFGITYLARQEASALKLVHEKHIMHLDINPNNILQNNRDEAVKCYLEAAELGHEEAQKQLDRIL